MKKNFYDSILLFFLISFTTFYSCKQDEENVTPINNPIEIPLEKEGYEVLLNEEFDDISVDQLNLNKTHWLIDNNGWDPDLLSIENGVLTLDIEIRDEKETFIGKSYSYEDVSYSLNQVSGVVSSEDIYEVNEGYLEVKVKFPKGGKNLYPSILIMDANWETWPSGFGRFTHIDSNSPWSIASQSFTMYSENESSSNSLLHSLSDDNRPEDFHVYGLEWRPGTINYFLDGEFLNSKIANWIQDDTEVYFMIAMLLDKNASAPTSGMEIEYIRLYKKE